MSDFQDACEICEQEKPRLVLYPLFGVSQMFIGICETCQTALIQSLVDHERPDQLRRRFREARK